MSSKIVLTVGLLLTAMGTAHAAETANFSVSGTISPPACEIALGNGGEAAYGAQTYSAVSAMANSATTYLLGTRPVSITVSCPVPRVVELAMVDNKPGQVLAQDAFDSMRYGLADGTGTVPIGHYQVQLEDVTVDGVTPPVTLAAPTGTTAWSGATAGGLSAAVYAAPGYAVGFAKTVGALVPEALTTIGGNLNFVTTVSKPYVDSATNSIELKGSGTINLQYL